MRKTRLIVSVTFVSYRRLERVHTEQEPNVYFEEFKRKLGEEKFVSVLQSHLIPPDEDSGIWDDDVVSGYKKFLEKRGSLLKEEFEGLLKTS